MGEGYDRNGDSYTTYSLSEAGFKWLMENEGKLVLKSLPPDDKDDSLPF